MLTWPLVPVVHWTPWDTACDLNFYSGDMHRPGRCLAQKAVSLIRETNSIGQNGRVVIKDHYCETSLSCPSWILHPPPPPNKTKQKGATKNNNKTKQKQENKKKTKKKQTNKNKQNNNNKKHKTITITKQKQKLNKNKTTKTTRTSPKTNNNSNQNRLIRNRKKCTGKETLNYR